MKTVRSEGKRWHVKCGGEVIKGTCIKCGEKDDSFITKIFGKGPLIVRDKDIIEQKRKDHIRRIREGRDIFRQ